MKNVLYTSLMYVFERVLEVVQFIGSALLEAISHVLNYVYSALSFVFKSVLRIIDKDRVHHAEQVVEQENIAKELQILVYVSKVKQDALETGGWTSKHSLALNQLSQRLYMECGWNLKKIHSYMRSIVESIPGLSYVSGNDDEDYDYDDDDDDDDDDFIRIGR